MQPDTPEAKGDNRMAPYMQIVLCEPDARDQVILGGASWPTMRETRARFDAVPSVPRGAWSPTSGCVLDLVNTVGDIVDDKLILHATVERLMGESLATLKAAALARLAEPTDAA